MEGHSTGDYDKLFFSVHRTVLDELPEGSVWSMMGKMRSRTSNVEIRNGQGQERITSYLSKQTEYFCLALIGIATLALLNSATLVDTQTRIF